MYLSTPDGYEELNNGFSGLTYCPSFFRPHTHGLDGLRLAVQDAVQDAVLAGLSASITPSFRIVSSRQNRGLQFALHLSILDHIFTLLPAASSSLLRLSFRLQPTFFNHGHSDTRALRAPFFLLVLHKACHGACHSSVLLSAQTEPHTTNDTTNTMRVTCQKSRMVYHV